MIIQDASFLQTVFSVLPDVEKKTFNYRLLDSAHEEAESHFRYSVLGDELYRYLEEPVDSEGSESEHHPLFAIIGSVDQVRKSVSCAIAGYALWLGIPKIDIVVTNNGLGIGESQNIKPASGERMRRLLENLLQSYRHYYDHALRSIAGHPTTAMLWSQGTPFLGLTHFLVWTDFELKMFGANSSRFETATLSAIVSAETRLRDYLSDELVDALIEARRSFRVPEAYGWLLTESIRCTAAYVSGVHDIAPDALRMVRKMKSDLDSFPEFKNSVLYQSQIKDRYDSSQDSGVAFFM